MCRLWELVLFLGGVRKVKTGGDYSPTLGISLPLTARVFPNTTVRLFVDAGSNPAGVNAVAAPASITRKNGAQNMIAAYNPKKMKNSKIYQ
jgi:hypothetical protein